MDNTVISAIVAFADRVDRAIIKIGNGMTVIFAVVVCISFYEVISRYLFNSPTSWVHETTTFLISLCLIFGGVFCYASDRHIAMVFIVNRFGAKSRWWTTFIVNNLVFAFVSMLLYGAYFSAYDAFFRPNGTFHMQTSGTALDSPFPAINKGFLLVACIVFFVLVVLHYIRHLAIRKAVFDGTYVARPVDGKE